MSNVRRRSVIDEPVAGLESDRELVARYREQISHSIDVFQIALLFESTGINDRMAAESYGARTVMSLAERIDRLVPFEAVEPDPPHRGLRPVALGLARGCLFVLVAIISMVVAVGSSGRASTVVLIGASMAATAIMPPLSFLSHLVRARSPKQEVGAVMGPLYRLGLAISAPIALIIWAVAGPVNALVFAGLLGYAQAAVVVLVLGRTWVFAAALIPGGSAAIASLASDGKVVPAPVAIGVAGVGTVALVGYALVAVRQRASLRSQVGSLEVKATWPFVRTGLTTAAFVGSFVWCYGQLDPLETAEGRTWFVLALPMFVPLAIIDAAVARLRIAGDVAARTSSDAGEFRRLINRALVLVWTPMLALGALGIVVSAAVGAIEGPGLAVGLAGSFWLVGAVLSARLSDPDPYDRTGPLVVSALTVGLAVFALIGDRLTTGATVGVTAGGLVVGFVVIEVDVWRRSRWLASHRWSI